VKRILVIGIIVVALICVIAIPTFAAKSLGKNWRVYNVKPATNSYWDINQPADLGGGEYSFPIQQFDSKTTGSFVVYFLNNYNISLTETQTITADVSWTPGTYETRSVTGGDGAYVGLEFQDTAAGKYDSNDYWWYTGRLNLNTATSGTLSASLSDRANWINQSGKPATDTETNWVEWQGDIVAMSPYDGFTAAMKNVKEIGLSFGSSNRFVDGIALDAGTGTFTVNSYTIN
jgi:hypothetical protein